MNKSLSPCRPPLTGDRIHHNTIRKHNSKPISNMNPLKEEEEAEQENKVLNLYQPDDISQNLHEHTPMNLYDINFVFPFECLQTDHVRLEPFVPSKHLESFLKLPPESWTHFGELGPYTPEHRMTALEDIESFRMDSGCLLLAIIDLQVERVTQGGEGFAGVYGLIDVNKEFMHALFGLINILPSYQRTHINTHSMYLILTYLFEKCNLIRIQYDAVITNYNSIKSAKRFGFKEEGVCRNFNGLVPGSKKRNQLQSQVQLGKIREIISSDIQSNVVAINLKDKSKSQHAWVGSLIDHDWFHDGVKENLQNMMKRPVVDTTKFLDSNENKLNGVNGVGGKSDKG